MNASQRIPLHMLLGNYPSTQALKDGTVRSDLVELEFADVPRPNNAFKRVVRDFEFDVAELAIITFLMAKARGKPLVLLPAVMIGRFQHPYILYNAERGTLSPYELNGRRIGLRSYSVTTATWVRGILQSDYGLDLASVEWTTFEEPHVAEFVDPPNVHRAPAGKELMQMLLDGEIDAAIVGDGAKSDPRIKTLFADPAAEAQAWHSRNQAIQINHMVVAKQSLLDTHPEAVREVFRLLEESRRVAASSGGKAEPAFGLEANRRNIEVAIDYCVRQNLIDRRLSVDELFDDVTRVLGA
ncbi:phosphate ABC transporter substrate-binding protein [Paraburkholderia sp.]|uniref:phosphate ABC transporter substrate-binding protein n=1 Tax=Paraburkholderia sp. TaxID=1926495 RepID=UPI003D6FD851